MRRCEKGAALEEMARAKSRQREPDKNLCFAIFGEHAEEDSEGCKELVRQWQSGCWQEVVANLEERQRIVIIHRFGLFGTTPKTLREVGAILGVTRERAREIEYKALGALRRPQNTRALLGRGTVLTRNPLGPPIPADLSVKNLDISQHIKNRLREAGLTFLPHVLAATDSELLSIPGFGYGSLYALRNALAQDIPGQEA